MSKLWLFYDLDKLTWENYGLCQSGNLKLFHCWPPNQVLKEEACCIFTGKFLSLISFCIPSGIFSAHSCSFILIGGYLFYPLYIYILIFHLFFELILLSDFILLPDVEYIYFHKLFGQSEFIV